MEEFGNKYPLRIGELAADLGLNPKTIRYYEKIGLLPEPERTPAGYRLYDDTDWQRLRFILKAKAIGLTLEEIGEILAVRDRGETPCEHVLSLLDTKITTVDAQLQALMEFREELVTLREEARQSAAANGGICRIIEHHTPAQSHESIRAPVTTLRPPQSR